MIKLIVGLGNPGERYAKTRHNAGFWLLDEITSHAYETWKVEKKFFALTAKVVIHEQPVHLLKPQTFMNNSGQAVAAICQFYQITANEILVAHDELDLPEGTVKLKLGGGHGGHNGLRDIIKAIDSKEFYRLRLGIGHPGDRNAVVDYVLKAPSRSGQQQLNQALLEAENILPILMRDGAEKAMNQLHSRH